MQQHPRPRRTIAVVALGVIALVSVGSSGGFTSASAADAHPWTDASRSVGDRVESLMEQMTVQEKVGQMVQINVDWNNMAGQPAGQPTDAWMQTALITDGAGSILNGGGTAPTPNIPHQWAAGVNALQQYIKDHSRLKIPIIYGFDAVHGNNNVLGAEIYPEQIGQGATADPAVVKAGEAATARGMKAMGVNWTFGPVLEVSRDVRYGRYYESFGEDPLLVGTLGSAAIQGFQGSDPEHPIVAATLKHYAGYSEPIAGHDRTMAQLPLRYLQETFLRPFKSGVDAGGMTAMANSGSVNEVPVTASHYLLTDILHNQMSFKGFTVSDWQDVFALRDNYHIASTYPEAIKLAVMAGVDMGMCQDLNFGNMLYSGLLQDAQDHSIPMWRIDQAVARILTAKFKLGLFEHQLVDATQADAVVLNNAADVATARKAADESMTLLKNDTVGKAPALPLGKGKNIVVTSTIVNNAPWAPVTDPIANNLADQMGGWTLGWQGVTGGGEGCCSSAPTDTANHNQLPGETILAGLTSAVAGHGGSVTFKDPASAPAAGAAADATVVVVGEPPYAEGVGDTESDQLSSDQTALVQAVASANTKAGKPTIVVVVAGRPLIMNEAISAANGLLMAYQPGSEGGNAVADVLFGDYNPSGRLPVSWPRNIGDMPFFYQYLPGTNSGGNGTTEGGNGVNNFYWFGGGSGYDPVFPFGYGLSYGGFAYAGLQASSSGGRNGKVVASVSVTYTGSGPADNIVEAFAKQPVSSIMSPPERLASFTRVHFDGPGTKTVTLDFPTQNLAVVGGDINAAGTPAVQSGAYQLVVENQAADEGTESSAIASFTLP